MSNPSLPVLYRRCDCCEKYSAKLSPRQWCQTCEREFKAVMERMLLIRERSRLA